MRATIFALIIATFLYTITALVPAQLLARHAITASESISKKWNVKPGSQTQTLKLTILSDDLPGGTLDLDFIWSLSNRQFHIDAYPFRIDLEFTVPGIIEGTGFGQSPVPNAQYLDINLDMLSLYIEHDQETWRLTTVELQPDDDNGVVIIDTRNAFQYTVEPIIQLLG